MQLVTIEDGKVVKQFCYICEREFNTNQGRFPVGGPQQHHQPPKQYYKRKNYKEKTIDVCQSCQRQIHAMFTNKELKSMTVLELKNHSTIKKWIQWICKNRKKENEKTT